MSISLISLYPLRFTSLSVMTAKVALPSSYEQFDYFTCSSHHDVIYTIDLLIQ